MPVRKLRLGSYLYDECFRAEADQVLATLGLDRLVESRGGGDQSVSVSRERVLEPADKRGEERRFHGRDQGPDGLRPAGCECSSGVVVCDTPAALAMTRTVVVIGMLLAPGRLF